MCSACGFPPSAGHWTDAGGQRPEERLRIRFQRVAILNKFLKPLRLGARDLGTQPGIQLFDNTGRTRQCPTLEDVWQEVVLMTGTAFDPLDISTSPENLPG